MRAAMQSVVRVASALPDVERASTALRLLQPGSGGAGADAAAVARFLPLEPALAKLRWVMTLYLFCQFTCSPPLSFPTFSQREKNFLGETCR